MIRLSCITFCILCLLARTSFSQIYGYTEPVRQIELAVAESGVLRELHVKEGDLVKADKVLARLDCRVLQADLEIAKEQLGVRRNRFDKLKELREKGISSKDEFTRAEANLKIEEFRVQRMEAMIERHTLRSPVDGVVSLIKRDIGESVTVGNPHVLTVVKLDRLRVNLFVPFEHASKYKKDQKVDLWLYGSKRKVPGTVEFVSPVTDAASNTVRVKFLLDNKQLLLKSGERCGVYELIKEEEDV